MSVTADASVKAEQHPTSSGKGYETWYDRLGETWINAAPKAILEDAPLRLQFIEQNLKNKIDGLQVLDLGIGGRGLTHRQFMGLMPIKAKPLAILNILTHKGSPGRFKLGPDLSVNYLGYATKA